MIQGNAIEAGGWTYRRRFERCDYMSIGSIPKDTRSIRTGSGFLGAALVLIAASAEAIEANESDD